MDDESKRAAIEAKLDKYRSLARQFSDSVTAKNLRELIAETEQQLRAISK